MNLQHRNTHRTRSEDDEDHMIEGQEQPIDEHFVMNSGPENKQGLKNELWTRIVKISDESVSVEHLYSILHDLTAFHEQPPDSVKGGRKPWALLFDPHVCDEEFEGKTLDKMELKEAKIKDYALQITEHRERLRATAAVVAATRGQLKFYDEKELQQL